MKLLSLLVGMLLAVPAVAQDYPNKPIRIITAFGPGTATDIAARVIGQDIAVQTGQTVVIENKPGAEGQIAAQSAAAAAPDGYTLFFTTQTTQAINPHVYKSLAYDPVKSFAPVAGITLGAQVVMVRNDLLATVKLCEANGCPLELILKDISTVRYDPKRLFEWGRVAMEIVGG